MDLPRHSPVGSPVRFRLIETIGRPDVYLAEMIDPSTELDTLVDRQVVLTSISLPGSVEEIRGRVQQRAAALEALAHPNITFARDLVVHVGRCMLLSDPIQGADLEHVLAALDLAGERLSLRLALSIGGGIFAAIAAAASARDASGQPIAHGSLRESCVYLTLRGGVRVAGYNHPASSESTREPHLAPERLIGAKPDIPGDVYAAASIVASLLTGRTIAAQPLPDLHSAAISELLRPLERQAASSRELRLAVDLLGRALDVKAARRPSPSDLQLALDRAAAASPGETLPAFAGHFLPDIDAILGRVSAKPSDLLDSEEGKPEAEPPQAPSRAAPILIFAAIFAICVAIAAWSLGTSGE